MTYPTSPPAVEVDLSVLGGAPSTPKKQFLKPPTTKPSEPLLTAPIHVEPVYTERSIHAHKKQADAQIPAAASHRDISSSVKAKTVATKPKTKPSVPALEAAYEKRPAIFEKYKSDSPENKKPSANSGKQTAIKKAIPDTPPLEREALALKKTPQNNDHAKDFLPLPDLDGHTALKRKQQENLSAEALASKLYGGSQTRPQNEGNHKSTNTSKESEGEIVFFPIRVKERSNQLDPSLEKTTQSQNVTKKSRVNREAENLALPSYSPVKTAVPTHQKITRKTDDTPVYQRSYSKNIIVTADGTKIPIPSKRPAIQSASKQFIKEASHKAQKQAKAERARHINLAEITNQRDAAPDMPAVPALSVTSENIASHSALKDDTLAKKILTPNKKQMVQQVEKIAALSKALSEFNQKKKPTSAQISKTANVIDITEQKPDHDLSQNMAEQLNAIEPAIGSSAIPIISPTPDLETSNRTEQQSRAQNAVSTMIPRAPEAQEENFISVALTSPRHAEEEKSFPSMIQNQLDKDIIPLMINNSYWNLQIQSYASPEDKSPQSAKRISLTRALAVREYLMQHNIDAKRIDVRALGMNTDRKPTDRMDFIFKQRPKS